MTGQKVIFLERCKDPSSSVTQAMTFLFCVLRANQDESFQGDGKQQEFMKPGEGSNSGRNSVRQNQCVSTGITGRQQPKKIV